jgi:ribosomal protein L37AE/L43A
MSKKVQNSGIWGIIGEIKKLPTHIMTDKFLKSTQDCSCCWSNKLMELKDRIYKCESCWFIWDRDMNSSYNILQTWIDKIIPLLQREINKKIITLNDLLWNKSLKQITG